jgi:hypothetical protein
MHIRGINISRALACQTLSYEWGLKAPIKEIDVMGQPKTIRENLQNFLSRLRSHRRNNYLWRGEAYRGSSINLLTINLINGV